MWSGKRGGGRCRGDSAGPVAPGPGSRQAGRGDHVARLDALHTGAVAYLQFDGLAGHGIHEVAARLLSPAITSAACSRECGVSIRYVASTRSSPWWWFLSLEAPCGRVTGRAVAPTARRNGGSTTALPPSTPDVSRQRGPRRRRGMPPMAAISSGCATRPMGVMATTRSSVLPCRCTECRHREGWGRWR